MSCYSSANALGRLRAVFLIFALLFCLQPRESVFLALPANADEAKAYNVLNGNEPSFSEAELRNTTINRYSELDSLGRCGRAQVCVGRENMPSLERGPIGQVRPSGWHTVRYDFIEDRYLYNRCHLIGYQLSGENANERNLITGTRYLNVEGMLPFENRIAHYVRVTGNHVLYRVTPIFRGKELVARGVQMEAMSVEDRGRGLKFNVFVPNIQPGVNIDYATGESRASGTVSQKSLSRASSHKNKTYRPYAYKYSKSNVKYETQKKADASALTRAGEKPQRKAATVTAQLLEPAHDYVINKRSRRFHKPGCQSVYDMKPKNRKYYSGSRQELISQGYKPCGACKP